ACLVGDGLIFGIVEREEQATLAFDAASRLDAAQAPLEPILLWEAEVVGVLGRAATAAGVVGATTATGAAERQASDCRTGGGFGELFAGPGSPVGVADLIGGAERGEQLANLPGHALVDVRDADVAI